MKKKLLFSISLFGISLMLTAQNVQLFTEDFQNGGNSFTLNAAGPGANFGPNKWTINNQYNGAPTYPNTMSQDSTYSGTIGFAPNSTYLHIFDSPSGIGNCNYNPTVQSSNFAYMTNGLCTLGMDSVHFSFFYLCEGSATAYGKVYYSKNNGPWIQVGQGFYNNKSKWKYEDITDPAFTNTNNLRFGFRWENNSGAAINSEAFGIDDVDIVGHYDNVVSPITITVDSVQPNPVCQGTYLFIYYHLSDSLCDGSYSLELSTATGTFPTTNNWVFNIYYPQTSGIVPVQLPTSVPAGTCYKVRISRTSPLPAITGTASACFTIATCPNVITTLQPVVTLDTNAVCIGSAIDIPFYSTGVYNFNTYTAQLSDSTGSFSNPSVVGTYFNSSTYDPSLGSPPGNVSGKIPNVPPGCGYYIRVVSNSPVALGSLFGPFCIRQCDIETNNTNDIHFCVTDCAAAPAGQNQSIAVGIHTFDTTAVYGPTNVFSTQMMSMMNFSQIGSNGILGSVAATHDTTLVVHVPCRDSLPLYGIPIGTNYMRVVASNTTEPDNALGSIIRVTIGAPHATGPTITSYDFNTFLPKDTFCVGATAALFFFPYNYNDKSTYLWKCNQINGGNPFVSPSGANSNSLYVNLGGVGILTFQVQENSYGCAGPWSPIDTVVVLGPPTVPISGPLFVCQGDTNTYQVPFFNNTYYQWSLSGGGSIVDTANNIIDVRFQSVGTFQVLVHAINQCGSANGTRTINVKAYPIVNAGHDTTICSTQSLTLQTPTGASYQYQWNNGTSNIGSSNSITVHPTTNTTYYLTVTGPAGCKRKDTVKVMVKTPVLENDTSGLCPTIGSLTLTADTTGNYSWSNGATSPQITVSDTGTYVLIITHPNEACAKMLTFYVEPKPCPDLVMPNIFSPNGNGTNDFFSPIRSGDFDKFKIDIYDRWGILLFESTDPYFKWDGTTKSGNKATDGTYYYIVETTYNSEDDKLTGYFMLIR